MGRLSRVALAGATGNLGPAILAELLAAGFTITVLTRKSSTHTFPSTVTVRPVDFTSLPALTAALADQDAVVSTLASSAIETQLLLVQAAVKAGVKRFIPSEFGADTLNERTRGLPVFREKVLVQEALKEEGAREGGMEYTIVCTGPFLDWGIMVGFILDLKGKRINLFDGGERLFSTTSLVSVGKAVVGVLERPGETRNRAVYVHDTALSLKRLLEMGKKIVGEEGWKENVVAVSEMLKDAWAEVAKEEPDPDRFVLSFLRAGIWGEGFGCYFEKTDNDLLGLREMSVDEVFGLVERIGKEGDRPSVELGRGVTKID